MAEHSELHDYAIVVGIDEYRDPDLPPLYGAGNDAAAFRKWLELANVDKTRILPREPFKNRGAAEPMWSQIDTLFMDVKRLFERRAGRKSFLGRRLYVFLSGHGCSAPGNFTDVRLLCVDSCMTERSTLPVMKWVDLFFEAKVFSEIVVFLDCCRTKPLWVEREIPPCFTAWLMSDSDRTSKFNIAFGCEHNGRSREHAWADLDGEYRGVFTRALLERLEEVVQQKAPLDTIALVEYLNYKVPFLWNKVNQERANAGDDPIESQCPTFYNEKHVIKFFN